MGRYGALAQGVYRRGREETEEEVEEGEGEEEGEEANDGLIGFRVGLCYGTRRA